MKTLKFKKKLSEEILKGNKNKTWRLFDDKDLTQGEIISFLIWDTNKEFAKAKLIKIEEKKFENLGNENLKGHEKFSSNKEMYDTYSNYYNKKITPKTEVKIIKFKLIK